MKSILTRSVSVSYALISALGAFAVVALVPAGARADDGCYMTTQPDLAGTKSYSGGGVAPPLAPAMVAKQGSIYVPPGVAMAIYPSADFEGDAVLVSPSNEELSSAFKKAADGGSYVNMADLSHVYFEPGDTAIRNDLKAFICVPAGTPLASGSGFFVHNLTTVYPGVTLHANANIGYSTDYEATLAAESGVAVLRLTVTPFTPHGGQITHYVVNFGDGTITIDAEVNGSLPATHAVYTSADGLAHKGAAGEVLSRVNDMVHMHIEPNVPVPELKEVADDLTAFLGR